MYTDYYQPSSLPSSMRKERVDQWAPNTYQPSASNSELLFCVFVLKKEVLWSRSYNSFTVEKTLKLKGVLLLSQSQTACKSQGKDSSQLSSWRTHICSSPLIHVLRYRTLSWPESKYGRLSILLCSSLAFLFSQRIILNKVSLWEMVFFFPQTFLSLLLCPPLKSWLECTSSERPSLTPPSLN